jgi:hypothetical protein
VVNIGTAAEIWGVLDDADAGGAIFDEINGVIEVPEMWSG